MQFAEARGGEHSGVTGRTLGDAFDRLRVEMSSKSALPILTEERYALTHARYEAASDQRSLLQGWVVDILAPLLADRDPVRVLGVGVGDGSVDEPLAAALAAGGRRVHYTGVEPHAGSAIRFAERLHGLQAPTLTPTVVIGNFIEHDAGRKADLVHFVHSLYYVDDLPATLDRGLAMLRPGGVLLAAIAPLRPLCVLTELLCPWRAHDPWFADDVVGDLERRGLPTKVEHLVAHLDVRDVLSDPCGAGEEVLDFLIGARSAALDSPARDLLLEYLHGISLPGRPGVVPHPLDIVLTQVS